jgi:ADP-ribose pyrophosphatase
MRLAAYERLREQRPALFENPPGAAFEIRFDRTEQDRVADEAAAKLRERGAPEEYGDIGVLYEDDYILLVRDAVRFRSGRLGAYVRTMGADPGQGCAVLPVLPDGRLVLVRHFRHDSRRWHWEIPRGFAEPDADPVANARRELREEIGVEPAEVVQLGCLDGEGGPDVIFLARITEAPQRSPDEDEGIDEVRLVTVAEFESMMRDGALTDGYALAAYAFARAGGLLPAGPVPEGQWSAASQSRPAPTDTSSGTSSG